MNLIKTIFGLALGKRLPVTSGALKVEGVQEDVTIGRDAYGIPHIEAKNEIDAWFGLGFCQGQDRCFQIEMLIRIVSGTLCEIVGKDALPVDRLSRRVGFRRSAESQMSAIAPEIMTVLDAFTRGVNQGWKVGLKRYPHEFALLRSAPSTMEPTHVIGVVKFMSFALASNWDMELARLKILLEDGPEAVAALDPCYPEWQPVISPPDQAAGPAVDALAKDIELFQESVKLGGGSNNWAISGERTSSGRPILANDPHLAPLLPPYWYLSHIRTPEWSAAGASLAGAPGYPVGHNEQCAWGVTAGLQDNTDLFLEEIGPDEKSVRQGASFVACDAIDEVIHIKGDQPVIERVLVTPRGPIVSPALEGIDRAISMRAVWLDPLPVRGILEIHKARNFQEFRSKYEDWPALPLNIAFADTSGAIGWQLVGQIPSRRKGWGTLPMAGWDPDAGWEGELVPFSQMPFAENPSAGFLATSNNQPVVDGSGPFLGIDWLDGYRQTAIVQGLEARKDWDLSSTKILQFDQSSIPWSEIKESALAAVSTHPDSKTAKSLLEAWDGVVGIDSSAASVFEYFISEMVKRIAKAKAPNSAKWAVGSGFTQMLPLALLSIRRTGHLVRLIRERPTGWFEGTWDAEIDAALQSAIRTLKDKFGADPSAWTWGRVRPITLKHPVGEKAPLNRIFNLGPFPWGGDCNTIGQASSPPWAPSADPFAVASMRMALDVGNWDQNSFSLPGGQSGNPLSPHYDDLFEFWRRGDGVRIAWSDQEVAKDVRSELRLRSR